MAQKFEVATQTMHYYKGEIPLKTKNTPTKTPSKKKQTTELYMRKIGDSK